MMENFLNPIREKVTQIQVVRKDQFKKQRLTGRVSQPMGRQKKNNPQMKGQEEISETMLNEKEQVNYQILSSKNWL